jgi:hypothetical protein
LAYNLPLFIICGCKDTVFFKTVRLYDDKTVR